MNNGNTQATDDLYPNESTYFSLSPATDRDREERQEEAEVLEEANFVDVILAHLQETSTELGSVDAIPIRVLVHPDEFMHTIAGNKKAKEVIDGLASWIVQMRKQHK